MNALPSEIEAALKAEAARCAPNEAVGFVLNVDGKLIFHPATNVAAEPSKFFRVGPDDFEAAEDAGTIEEFFHSHVNESPEPGYGDKTVAEREKIKLRILSYPSGEMATYEPCGWRAPLLGRPFVHGVLDCYTIFLDAYDLGLEIKLTNFEREDDWWFPLKKLPDGTIKRTNKEGEILAPPKNLYLENFQKAGFRRVDDIKPWDAIMIQISSEINSDVPPNHSALYLGDGDMLHHVQDRISLIQPYVSERGYYGKHCYGIYRHESNPEMSSAEMRSKLELNL